MKEDQIEIPLSKTKLWLGIVGSFIFLIIGIWMLASNISSNRYNPLIIKVVAIVAIIFFGACGIFLVKKLFDKESGLIISKKGIFDNTSGVSIGLIIWDDIVDIRVQQIMANKFITIHVKDPEKYIGKAKNKMMARIMKSNMNMSGTPISISSNTLKYNFKNLNKLLIESYKKYKS